MFQYVWLGITRMEVKMHEPVAFEGTLEPRAWPCFIDYSPLQPLIVLICVVIGSLGIAEEEQGVENVTVSNVDFTATSNGVRIKTWAKNSKSFARNIVFQHINMKMVKNPIIIDQHYCFYKPCPEQESGVEVSNVRYEDIHGTSSTDVAVKLDCSKEKPCTGIVMDNVNLALQLVNQLAQASCSNANGLANDVVIPFTPYIHGTSSTDVAVKLDCSKEKPCTGIVMDNVNLAFQLVNQPAQASCSNANGLANDVVIPFTPCLKRDILMT
ncbi:hypothetical protein F2Q70_00008800 [Brassica cretica]|uniref:Polygalacturonase n=1 Tax=Brassica cretica TaxID=69181 RepID=A0A8S9M899_BRACR|nr:hypothetical protein F2Q70_00008800 [Brassica cretica]